jgi:hypothetical protein
MDISGKIFAILEAQSGISKSGNEWKKQEYVLETQEQYPKKVCFQIFGAERIEQAGIHSVGEEVTVSIDIESREYQGRWYTNINAWKVEHAPAGSGTGGAGGGFPSSQPTSAPASAPAVSQAAPPDFPPPGKDDLPF